MLTAWQKFLLDFNKKFDDARIELDKQAAQHLLDLRVKADRFLHERSVTFIENKDLPQGGMYPLPHEHTDEGRSEILHGNLEGVMDRASDMIGYPYKYGGGDKNGPTVGIVKGEQVPGFDCSGLVVYAYADLVPMPRTTGEQYKACAPALPESVGPGTLAFSNFNGEVPGHVSIMVDRKRCIEAGDPVNFYNFDPASRGRVVYGIPKELLK